jgi:hypothetical protein
MPPLTPIASCTRPDIAGRYLTQALSYMPRDDLAPLHEASPQLDPDSLMLFPSTLGRAQGALSWPLLTARGSQINPGGNPDPNRAGLSRGDIERVRTMYPQRRVAPRQATEETLEKQVAKRWFTVPYTPPGAPPQGLQAWPPWPNTHRQTITYCYEDQPAADALTRLFEAGLAKWAPAFRVSNVEFITDPNCFQLPCLRTTSQVSPVTVHIMQARVTWPLSTLGYRDHRTPVLDPRRPRHFIQWPAPPVNFQRRGPLYMAQAIGERSR